MPRRRNRPLWTTLTRIPLVLLGLVAQSPVCAQDMSDAWKAVSEFRFLDAHLGFRQAAQSSGSAEAKLGEALTLLNQQPRTESRVEECRRRLQELVDRNPRSPLGIEARFYLARIDHINRSPADPQAARAAYLDLARDHPGHPLAQQGLVKVCLMDIYGAAPEDRAAAIAEKAAWADRFTERMARRDYHLALGYALVFFKLSPEKALEHLLAAEASGVSGFRSRSDLLVAIGDLAEELNHPEIAVRVFTEFARDYPRDIRAYTVRQRAAALNHRP